MAEAVTEIKIVTMDVNKKTLKVKQKRPPFCKTK